MSEKKLLEEGAVRRFMQLANIKPLNENEAAGGRGLGFTRGENGRALAVEALEEEGQVEEGWSMEEAEEPGMAPEMGDELGGGEETGMEGGDIKSALEQIKAGLNALLGHLPESGGEEFDLEDESGEEEEPAELGGEEEDEGLHEELEEEGLYEELEEEGLEEDLEEEGKKVEEKKHYGKHGKKMEEKKHAKKHGKKEELEEEALAEELTRRVAARLVAEMKKGGAGIKQGAPFNKAAPKSKSAGHKRNLTSGNTVAEGSGAKSNAPKGHGVGVKQGAPFNKTAPASKSAKHKRNLTTGNTVAGKGK
jgi:hypothetical protein